ncbi:MAG: alpha/beta fold hydrolase [Nanoarchaeota archaeon]|nr:alpha/beta fold hydrolase [Nanoarchaeota archaeon]
MKFSEKEIIIGIILIIMVVAFSINIFWADPVNVNFCGDGKCTGSEVGECKIDCDWCGDGYCQSNEDCSSCSNDCGVCGSGSFCGDGVCNLGECNSACWNDCSYLECEDGICDEEKGENCVNSPNDCSCSEGYCDSDSQQCVYQSCGNNNCESHESYLNCPNDCSGVAYSAEDNSGSNYPIIFVHGHSVGGGDSSFSLHTFTDFQDKLASDGLYEDRGYILASEEKNDFTEGQWSNTLKPLSFRTTYYLGEYSSITDSILQDDNHPISEYSTRLSKVVANVLYATGKDKVIIIAHSMGGLVSRDYIKNRGGENKVDKLITIGTPNHGTYGYSSFACESPLSRSSPSPECDDMNSESEFIVNLNSGDETPGNIDYLAIIGKGESGLDDWGLFCPGDEDSDGVVCESSAHLSGATIYEYEKKSSVDRRLHSALVHPSEVPEVYNKIVEFLG